LFHCGSDSWGPIGKNCGGSLKKLVGVHLDRVVGVFLDRVVGVLFEALVLPLSTAVAFVFVFVVELVKKKISNPLKVSFIYFKIFFKNNMIALRPFLAYQFIEKISKNTEN
jgi:hypothetical protein